MRIGIDIDGVLTNIMESIINYGTKFCYENKIDYSINLNEYDETNILGISEENTEKFWNKYLAKYAQECPTRDFAPEVISKLKENNEIYIITARNEEGLPKEYYGTMQKMVKEWLNKNNIEYDKIIFSKEKADICISNNIDIMIEDSPKNILSISKETKTICFDAPYNRNIKGENIIRAYSWYDILNILKKLNKI